MKRCPSCGEWNDDKVLRCWQCREWFDEISTPGKKRLEETVEKKKAGAALLADLIKQLPGIWKQHAPSIMVTLILLFVVFFTILQRPDENTVAPSVGNKPSGPAVADVPVFPRPVLPPASPAVFEKQTELNAESTAAGSAYELFNKAVELCPGGKCTDPQKAIEYLDEAIKLKPNYAGAFNNRGNIYCGLGQFKKAIEDYNQAIALKPDYALALGNRGGAYDYLGQHKKAIEDYNQAISLKPDYTNAYVNRASAYLDDGNKALGCPDAEKACELGSCATLETARKKGLCQ